MQPLSAVGRRSASNLKLVFPGMGPATKSVLPKAELHKRHAAKLEELNAWILSEEKKYLASKGESKNLDQVVGTAPMKLYGVSGRYAMGLYNAATKAKELGKVDADVKKLVAAADSSPVFHSFLLSPTLSRSERQNAMDGLCKTLGLCGTTKNFLLVLADSSRTKNFLSIAKDFNSLTAAAAGELTVTLTTPGVRGHHAWDAARTAAESRCPFVAAGALDHGGEGAPRGDLQGVFPLGDGQRGPCLRPRNHQGVRRRLWRQDLGQVLRLQAQEGQERRRLRLIRGAPARCAVGDAPVPARAGPESHEPGALVPARALEVTRRAAHWPWTVMPLESSNTARPNGGPK